VHHETPLIAMIAMAFVLAFIGGFAAVQLRLPAIVGYLMAGIAVGPFTPGFVGDPKLASELAEIGVILLMFGVGMHFSVRDLWAVRTVALPGAIAQIIAATLLGIGVTTLWGWPFAAGLVFGLALSVASTVVLLRALETTGTLHTPDGRIAVGWLIVEDLVMVLTLVLLPPFAAHLGGTTASHDAPGNSNNVWLSFGITIGKVAVFVALMLLIGTRFFPWLLRRVERTNSQELFTLAVVALALGVAFGSARLFGVSFALGAFFAGVVINESELTHRAASGLQPLRDAFGVLFFVAVGMLFDPRILVQKPLQVIAVVAIIVVGKSLAALGIVLALRRPLSTALTVSAALAQIGEFSFILAALGVELELEPREGQNLIVAGALISITLNPLVFRAASLVPRRKVA
jgi:CPA2 family monovalent cation:H+ antiporter-2